MMKRSRLSVYTHEWPDEQGVRVHINGEERESRQLEVILYTHLVLDLLPMRLHYAAEAVQSSFKASCVITRLHIKNQQQLRRRAAAVRRNQPTATLSTPDLMHRRVLSDCLKAVDQRCAQGPHEGGGGGGANLSARATSSIFSPNSNRNAVVEVSVRGMVRSPGLLPVLPLSLCQAISRHGFHILKADLQTQPSSLMSLKHIRRAIACRPSPFAEKDHGDGTQSISSSTQASSSAAPAAKSAAAAKPRVNALSSVVRVRYQFTLLPTQLIASLLQAMRKPEDEYSRTPDPAHQFLKELERGLVEAAAGLGRGERGELPLRMPQECDEALGEVINLREGACACGSECSRGAPQQQQQGGGGVRGAVAVSVTVKCRGQPTSMVGKLRSCLPSCHRGGLASLITAAHDLPQPRRVKPNPLSFGAIQNVQVPAGIVEEEAASV